MKNIIFLEQFSNIGGGQRVLLDIISGLDKSRYRPYVVIPAKGELSRKLEAMDVHYFVLPIGSYSPGKKSILDIFRYLIRSPLLMFLCARLLRKQKINMVYANAPRTFLWGTIAAKISKVPVIWHLHSIPTGIELKVCLKLYKYGVDKLITVSNSVAEPFLRAYPSLSAKINVVYTWVDLTKFDAVEDGSKIRKELDISDDIKIVAFIGQLSRWKGVEDFIRAAQMIIREEGKTFFLVVGDVMFGGRKEYRQCLVDLAGELGIAKNIRVLGARKDFIEMLKGIDILVVPSIKPDPCPWILLGGMAAGKPVVASAHGGPAEIIKDDVNGMLYRPGDIKDLAESILFLLRSPEDANKIGIAARQTIENGFKIEMQMSSILRIISGEIMV